MTAHEELMRKFIGEARTGAVLTDTIEQIRAVVRSDTPDGYRLYYYLLRDWRVANAPHVPLTCDFDATWGYSMHNDLLVKNQEYQQFALSFYKEAASDMLATVTKRA